MRTASGRPGLDVCGGWVVVGVEPRVEKRLGIEEGDRGAAPPANAHLDRNAELRWELTLLTRANAHLDPSGESTWKLTFPTRANTHLRCRNPSRWAFAGLSRPRNRRVTLTERQRGPQREPACRRSPPRDPHTRQYPNASFLAAVFRVRLPDREEEKENHPERGHVGDARRDRDRDRSRLALVIGGATSTAAPVRPQPRVTTTAAACAHWGRPAHRRRPAPARAARVRDPVRAATRR